MIQIRNGVFETNSSSTHSITICTKDEYHKWRNGELYLNLSSSSSSPSEFADKLFVTREEAIDIASHNKYCPGDTFDLTDISEDDLNELEAWLEEYEILSIDFYNRRASEYEEFEESYHTPSGDEVVAFGYYGYN